MGLDAVVYKHVSNIRSKGVVHMAKVEDLTGEVYFEDDHLNEGMGRDFAIAEEVSLGNLSEIGALRIEVRTYVDNSAIILRSILVDGSHSGDVIGVDSISSLINEVELIENSEHSEPSIQLRKDQETSSRRFKGAESHSICIEIC